MDFLKGFSAVQNQIISLKKRYKFLSLTSIGKSVLGKNLYCLSIGRHSTSTLYVGGVHGQEWLTSLLLLRFAEELLEAIEKDGCIGGIAVEKILENSCLYIIPCLNPDGVDIACLGREGAGRLAPSVEKISQGYYGSWNANARGVDLNHNFDAGFSILRQMEEEEGISGPAPRRYSGPTPESEPETKALVKFCKSHPIQKALAFHSQGEEIYYRYGDRQPQKSEFIAGVLASSSGYRLADPEGLASHGGFKDWFIKEFVLPAFTIEIGRGQNPLPIEELEPIYARLLELLILGIIL